MVSIVSSIFIMYTSMKIDLNFCVIFCNDDFFRNFAPQIIMLSK